MLQPMDYLTKEEFINDQYEKLSETGKTKFRMKVAKKSIDLDRALYLWSFFGWFGFHQLYLKNYGAFFVRLFTMSCFLTLWFKDRFTIKDDVKKYNTEVELQAILELI